MDNPFAPKMTFADVVAILVREPFSMSVPEIAQLTPRQVDLILNSPYIRRMDEERARKMENARKARR